MKRACLLIILITSCSHVTRAQFRVDYDPQVQPRDHLQYFTPSGSNLFVGDCIPFYHNGTYYLYWLIDAGHHSSLNGLGGHQWVLSTTRDLKTWVHYPVVIGIDEDWEKSICTGSVAEHGGTFYAFYATRLINSEGKVNEQLSYATSKDAIHFEKQKPNPFYTSAPGYNKRDFRDPKVVVDEAGTFHLFVSSSRESDYSMDTNRGCLVHLSSADLKTWTVNEPILTGQGDVPECPDYFRWNGWYYLLYGQGGNTFYLMSEKPYGPWIEPRFQVFDEDWSNVVKTAEFTGGRRIAASWIPSRKDNKDNGWEIFGGSALLREVIQLKDGTLATRFPQELDPRLGEPLEVSFDSDPYVRKIGDNDFQINAFGAIGAFHTNRIPVNCRIECEVDPQGTYWDLGLCLRATDKVSEGYRLGFSAGKQSVRLADTGIQAVEGLDKPFRVDVIMEGDIIDVCINGQRCIVNRLPEKKGDWLWFYARHGSATFRNIRISPMVTE